MDELYLHGRATHGQPYTCYQVVEHNTGIPALYNTALDSVACSLKTLVNNTGSQGFVVLGYDLYPALAYVDPYETYRERYETAVTRAEAAYQSFVLVTKEHRQEGEIAYRLKIKFPTLSPFAGLTPFERDAISNQVLDAIKARAGSNSFSSGHNPEAEIAGLTKLTGFFSQVINGNLQLGGGSFVGWDAVPIGPGEEFDRTGNQYSGQAPGHNQHYVYDYTGLKTGTTATGFYFYRDSIAVELNSGESILDNLTHAYIITDSDNTAQDLNAAESNFKTTTQKIIIWMHFWKSSSGSMDTVYVKFNDNLTDQEAEDLVNYYFYETMKNWVPEEILNPEDVPVAVREDEMGSHARSGNCNCSSLSWQWGKCCLLGKVESGDWKEFKNLKFQAGIGIGMLDGLLGTIQTIYEAGKKAVEVGGGFWKRLASYTREVVSYGIRNRSLWKTVTKVWDDSVDALKKAWNEIVEIYKTAVQFIDAVVSNFIPIVNGLWEGIVEWLGGAINGEAGPGYDVGVLAFDVVLSAFTGGSAGGAKFLPKVMKWLEKLKSEAKSLVSGLLSEASSKIGKVTGLGKKVNLCRILGKGCFVAGTPVLMASNANQFSLKNAGYGLALAALPIISPVPIQEVQLLDYAVANKTVNAGYGLTASTDDDIYLGLMDKDPYTSDQQRERDEFELDDKDWNEVVFEEVYGGSTAKLALHNDWINQKGYQVDAIVNLDLPEQGINGAFRISSIKHIIPQKKPTDEDEADDYDYRPVTGLFIHEASDVWKIKFDNGEELGVTNNHPIFSNTKGDWEFAGHLEIGEEVLAKSGCTKVVSKELDHVQEVYNLEVKDYHNFLVNASGIVVHNNGLCDFLKSLFNKYKSWRKAEPDWGLDESKVNDLMVALKNNVPEVYSTPIYTTTHNGTTYMVNGHHRLKAAKRLKIEQGIDIELQHYDINPNQIHTIEGGRFKNIQELINQSFGPND